MDRSRDADDKVNKASKAAKFVKKGAKGKNGKGSKGGGKNGPNKGKAGRAATRGVGVRVGALTMRNFLYFAYVDSAIVGRAARRSP